MTTTGAGWVANNTINIANAAVPANGIIFGAATPNKISHCSLAIFPTTRSISVTAADKNVLQMDMASDTIDTSGITSYAATSETRAFSLDGWTQGTLKSVFL